MLRLIPTNRKLQCVCFVLAFPSSSVRSPLQVEVDRSKQLKVAATFLGTDATGAEEEGESGPKPKPTPKGKAKNKMKRPAASTGWYRSKAQKNAGPAEHTEPTAPVPTTQQQDVPMEVHAQQKGRDKGRPGRRKQPTSKKASPKASPEKNTKEPSFGKRKRKAHTTDQEGEKAKTTKQTKNVQSASKGTTSLGLPRLKPPLPGVMFPRMTPTAHSARAAFEKEVEGLVHRPSSLKDRTLCKSMPDIQQCWPSNCFHFIPTYGFLNG